MKISIRCFISCILPCEALDVIRIVHANGRIEEISGTVKAAEIMKLHPNHVLKKPSSHPFTSEQKVSVVPPDADLKRGSIYFLTPLPSSPSPSRENVSPAAPAQRKEREPAGRKPKGRAPLWSGTRNSGPDLAFSDRHLSGTPPERITAQKDSFGSWRPLLDSIYEIPVDT